MADETIGVARIDLIADSSGFETEIAKAKSRLSSFSTDAQKSYDGLSGAAKRATANFTKWVDGLDRTAESSKLVNAAFAGVPLSVLEEARQKILDLRAANESAAAAAKELAAAQAFEKQAADAQRLVQASEYVNWWKDALQQAEAAQAAMVEDQVFAGKVADAQRLVQATEYVRWWEDALQQADVQEAKLSSDRAFIQSLENRANAAGKTASELLEMQAAQRGLTDQAAPFIAKLREQEGAVRTSGITFNEYGLSAKQTAAALRQVPAQITDIVVSLQGGQRPLTVLLQQGGQLKDIFGGVVPAAKALGGALIGMINPATLALGALATLVVAWNQGATEMDEMNKTLIMTGNSLGLTVGSVQEMADEMDKLGGVTRSSAVAALTEVAKSGKIAGDQIQTVASIAAESAQLLGRVTKDVIAEFAKIADDPVKGIEELNRQYHFLTGAVDEQIRSLVEQGRTQDAVRLGVETFSSVTQKRLDDVRQSLGLLQGAWAGLKGVVKETWDAMLNIGRPDSAQEIIRKGEESLNSYIDTLKRYGLTVDSTMKDVESKNLFGMDHARVIQAIAGAREIQSAMADARAQAAGADFTAQAEAAEAGRVEQATAARQSLDDLRKSLRSREELRDEEIANVKKWAKEVGASESEVSDLIEKINKKYEDKKKDPKGKKRTILYDNLDDLIASPNIQNRLEGIHKEYDSIANLVDGRLADAQKKYSRELEAMGQGDWARQINSALQSVEDKYADIAEARRNSDAGLSDQQAAQLQIALDKEKALVVQHYADLKAAQADWVLGAQDSLKNYENSAANVYDSVGQLATKSFKAMEDALTEFVTTGKASFSDLANSIISDMVRIAIQQSITGPLAGALGGALSNLFGPSNPAGATYGAAINNGTSTSYAVRLAKGGVYDSPSLSAYSNQIHDTPKLFAFSRGAGVFGEAGPEAIMPLKRGPDGRLGVSTQGGGSGDVTVNIINNSSQPVTSSQPKISVDSMGRMVVEIMIADLQRNGPYARQLKGAM